MRALAVASLLALGLTACGGDEPIELDGEPTAAQPTGEPQVGDEQQLRDLVEAYDAALDEVQTRPGDPAVFDGVLAPGLARTFATNYERSAADGIELEGSWVFEVEEVSIDGDRATVETCADGTDLRVITERPGGGQVVTPQRRTLTTLVAERAGGQWLISSSERTEQPC